MEVKIAPTTVSLASEATWQIAIMAEEHDSDWSGDLPHSSENVEIVSLSNGVREQLASLLIGDPQILEKTTLDGIILAAYKTADRIAEASNISASLLMVLLQADRLHIGSVGICKCFLIRNEAISQINVDDYLRIEADEHPFVATSSLLTNTVGTGELESLADIHLAQYTVDSKDLLLLCSSAFNENVSQDEILRAATQSSNPKMLCGSLAEIAIQRLRPSDSLALCVLGVTTANNRSRRED